MENEDAKKAEKEDEEKAVVLTMEQLKECFGSFKIGTCDTERAAFFIKDILDGEFSHIKWVD